MPTRGIRNLSFDYGLEEVRPTEKIDRARLPASGDLPPSSERPSSMQEDLVRLPSYTDAVDEFVRPMIADTSICRPQRYNKLLDEAEEALIEMESDDPELKALMKVLEDHSDMRDLLHYYLQSLLNA
ncbi:MAG: hypothetical protein AAFY56_07880 [Pseudomonadota bacterium]